ncbi:MAG: THUMP domain-containing protein [Nitrososphaeria archaeon]|nr:THUMP domain-containing protein [Aigarchaeota archaeon]MCX8187645.1 THUMP domain-containing protein [Nitrososphaeria archaeon]MDW8021540.1 THUMP domain-containing protein [Nitrososphaerota archaeon]
MKKFNLIATTPRGQENLAAIELEDLLKSLGDESPKVSLTSVAGLLTANTRIDPFKVINDVRKIIEEEPWRIVNLRRLIPIEEVVESTIEEISRAVQRLSSKIPEDATFRITIEKRHTSLSSSEIIEAAAKNVNRKVNLKNPDWVILIEVVGALTGISVIKPDQVLSISKAQR